MSPLEPLDPQACHRACAGREARFDGRFYLAVTTTGIYCRPSCPARTPRFENCRFYRTAAAASAAGFRACKLCRPDTAPGTRQSDPGGDLAARAVRLIAEGYIDSAGVTGLARRLAVSERTLRRTLVDQVGATPQQVATVRRVQTARTLLEQTDLSMTDVAFASGFGSIRQFNDVVAAQLGSAPSAIRAQARSRRVPSGGRDYEGERGREREGVPGAGVVLRLRHREPLAWAPLLAFLAAHAVPGLEEAGPTRHRRLVQGLRGPHQVTLLLDEREPGALPVALDLADLADLTYVVAAVRRWLDLDADPDLVDSALAADPALAPLVAARPGLRLSGAVDGWETSVATILGQQVSLAAARTFAARLVSSYGDAHPSGLTSFPTASTLAGLDPTRLAADIGVTRARAVAVVALAQAVDGGLELSPSADPATTRAALLALPGVGDWTADLVALRVLGDPDAFLPSDLVARRAMAALTPGAASLPTPTTLTARAEAWRPWRGYALMHLWTKEAFS